MELSCYQSEKNIKLLKKYIKFFDQIGYGNLNFSGIYKWSSILYNIDNTFPSKTSNLKILDIGGGLGPLDQILTKYGNVYSIDLKNDRETWFPTNENYFHKLYKERFYNESKGFLFDKEKLNRICCNFWELSKFFDESYFDLIVDGCSMIHFSNYGKKNDTFESIFKSGKIIHKLLKDDGVFITTSDVATPWLYESRDMIFAFNFNLALSATGFTRKTPFKEDLKKNWKNFDYMKYSDCASKSSSKIHTNGTPSELCSLMSLKMQGRNKVRIEVYQGVYKKSAPKYPMSKILINKVKKESAFGIFVKIVSMTQIKIKKYYSGLIRILKLINKFFFKIKR